MVVMMIAELLPCLRPWTFFFCLSLLVPILPYITDKTNSNNASQNEEAC
jgi:hypothetical protein